jgi:hypothetical protein
MPAIAYTSGSPWWEPPTIGGNAWWPFGRRGSVFGSQGSIEALAPMNKGSLGMVRTVNPF